MDDVWFRLYMDTDDDHATITLDGHGRILTWSDGAERIQGTGPEAIGRPAEFVSDGTGATGIHIDGLLDLARDRGHVTRIGYTTTADGRRVPADFVITALRGPMAAA